MSCPIGPRMASAGRGGRGFVARPPCAAGLSVAGALARALVVLGAVCLAACQSPQPQSVPSPVRDAAVESLSVACLGRIYIDCSREAMRRRMDGGEAAACSVVYETLLRRGFGGDFDAFLEWSRAQPEEPAAESNECS